MIGPVMLAIRMAGAITAPDVPHARAWSAAVAIVVAADEYPVELIAAIAYGESRYQAAAISADGRDCGPMGVRSRPRRCAAIRADELLGYRSGVQKLRDARAFCERRGDATVACTIAGYQGGPAAVRAHERGEAWTRRNLKRLTDRASSIRSRMGLPPS